MAQHWVISASWPPSKARGTGPSISLNFKESLSRIFVVMTQEGMFTEFVSICACECPRPCGWLDLLKSTLIPPATLRGAPAVPVTGHTKMSGHLPAWRGGKSEDGGNMGCRGSSEERHLTKWGKVSWRRWYLD